MSKAKSESAALAVCSVSHWYGARMALQDVSFAVERGGISVLLGLNGAGKSTLFSLITRLYATSAGRIEIFGADVGVEPGRALADLGIVFQSRALDSDLTVAQNLIYHAALHGIGRAEALTRADAALRRVNLIDRLGERVGNLSGGQARRVEIARALLHRPRLLLLDEPTVGLDVRARAAILTHVRALAVEEGIGVLWATHLIDEARPGDNVVVLHKGRKLADGRADTLVAGLGARDLAEAFGRLTNEESMETA